MDVLFPLFVFGILGTFILLFAASHVPELEVRWLRAVLLSGFLLRLASATMFAVFPETRIFHEDATGYEWIGQLIAANWKGEGPPYPVEAIVQNYGYCYFVAAIYYVIGAFRAAPSYVNTIIGSLTIFFVYRLARILFHAVVARRAALLVAFIPSMILWNSMALKDTLMTLLIVIALSSCVSLKHHYSTRALLGTVLPVIAMQPIRFYMIYFLTIAILGSLFLERGIRALSGISKQAVVIAAVVGLLVVAGFAGRAEQGMEVMNLNYVSSFRRGMATTAQSGFAHDVDISTPVRALIFLPVGIVYLILAPFPWQFNALRPSLAAPEMIIWWLLIPSLIRGIRWVIRNKFADCSPLLLFSLILTVAYSLIHGNIGSSFRQRAQIFVFLFIFTAVGQYVKLCQTRNIDERLLLQGTMSGTPSGTPAAAESTA